MKVFFFFCCAGRDVGAGHARDLRHCGYLNRGHGPLLRHETFIVRCSRLRRWRSAPPVKPGEGRPSFPRKSGHDPRSAARPVLGAVRIGTVDETVAVMRHASGEREGVCPKNSGCMPGKPFFSPSFFSTACDTMENQTVRCRNLEISKIQFIFHSNVFQLILASGKFPLPTFPLTNNRYPPHSFRHRKVHGAW